MANSRRTTAHKPMGSVTVARTTSYIQLMFSIFIWTDGYPGNLKFLKALEQLLLQCRLAGCVEISSCPMWGGGAGFPRAGQHRVKMRWKHCGMLTAAGSVVLSKKQTRRLHHDCAEIPSCFCYTSSSINDLHVCRRWSIAHDKQLGIEGSGGGCSDWVAPKFPANFDFDREHRDE